MPASILPTTLFSSRSRSPNGKPARPKRAPAIAFVARDQAFRFRNGDEGFSALAFGSDDAAADDRAFREAGISGGTPLEFARTFTGPSGERAEAAFHLAFRRRSEGAGRLLLHLPARPPAGCRPPRARTACQWRRRHLARWCSAKRTRRISSICCSRSSASVRVASNSFGITLSAGNGRVSALTPEGVRAFLGEAAGLDATRPAAGGHRFPPRRPGPARADAEDERRARFTVRRNRVVVPRAPGQGTIFAFEETA